jgi:hypothetical protein
LEVVRSKRAALGEGKPQFSGKETVTASFINVNSTRLGNMPRLPAAGEKAVYPERRN